MKADSAALLAAHSDDECCMFTTTGRVSGKPHRIEIWFGVSGDMLYIISGNGAVADWYQNAMANQRVTIEFDDDVLHGIASAVTGPEERRRIGDLMGAKYSWNGDPSIGLTRQKWCYEVPLLRVDF